MIYESIRISIPSLLNPSLTASWEKGLKLVNDEEIKPEEFMSWEKGLKLVNDEEIKPEEFMMKLETYTKKNTHKVLQNANMGMLLREVNKVKDVYAK